MTNPARTCTAEESGAFVRVLDLPPLGAGPLDGLRFAVKDLIDVAGHPTGCGNPTWRDTHPVPPVHAVCVEQLLQAGARCVGTTVTDELAFSLLGENYHYGTPRNAQAPDRVPGGSSSGSASAVSCGLAEIALGTDTGGSVRVPASNCGIWGLRPTHGVVSVAGVMPFAPTFDTVSLFAADGPTLTRAAAVLVNCEIPADEQPGTVHLLREAFELADPDVRAALQSPVQQLRERWGRRVRETSLQEIDGEAGASAMEPWYETYRILQWAEIWSCLGPWITATKPSFGPAIAASFELARTLDRREIGPAVRRREQLYRRMAAFLGPEDLLCIPTAPTPAPVKGSNLRREVSGMGYFPRALSLTSLAGIARLPQVTMPMGRVNHLPIGLSLLGRQGADGFLLGSVGQITESVRS
jgi:amidase